MPKYLLMSFLEKLVGRKVITPQQVNWEKIKKILVVRQHDQLGDFLLSVPALDALRNRFPQAEIGLIMRGKFAEIAPALPMVQQLLVWKPKEGWSRRSFTKFWKLLRQKWDLAVVLNTVSHSSTSDLLAFFSRAPYILGSEHKVFPGCSRNFLYNLLAPWDLQAKHQTEHYLDTVRWIGADTDQKNNFLVLSNEEKKLARDYLQQLNWVPWLTTIGIHIGARKLSNRWAIEKFIALARQLKNKGYQILLFWGPDEIDLKNKFLGSVSFQPILCEPVSLLKLAALFTYCNALIVNDTGVMHLSAALGVPFVAIFGETDPAIWKPRGERFRAVRGSSKQLENVSVQDVYLEVLQLLENIDIVEAQPAVLLKGEEEYAI